MKKFIKVILGVFFCTWIMTQGISVEAKSEDTILDGVYIDTLDVSGMTAAEAEEAVSRMVETRMETTITLFCANNNEVKITPSQLEMEWSNPEVIQEAVSLGRVGNVIERYKIKKDLKRENHILHISYTLNTELLDQLVENECTSFDQDAEDLSLTRVDGEFQIIEGRQGIHLDVEYAQEVLEEFVLHEWEGNEVVFTLPVIKEEPKGTAEELGKVKDVLGTYTTYYDTSGASRVANVENGTRLVNGATLYPGETFSMLEHVAPFTEANGYQKAGSYLNGMVVDSLGGGVCQVSTTLYNAVLRAELDVTERNNHSMSVTYVPLSADAAVAESAGKDFCFVNNTDAPIYIEGVTTPNKQVTFTIYGKETRSAGHQVDYVSEITDSIYPTVENIIQDASKPIGYAKVQSAHIGYKARLIKVVYENGVETGREVINKSSYNMVPRTVTVGVATDNPDAYNQMQAAIATGSIDQVCAVAGSMAAPVQQEAAPEESVVPDI